MTSSFEEVGKHACLTSLVSPGLICVTRTSRPLHRGCGLWILGSYFSSVFPISGTRESECLLPRQTAANSIFRTCGKTLQFCVSIPLDTNCKLRPPLWRV